MQPYTLHAEGGHFARDDCFTKMRRPVSTLNMKKLEYLDNFFKNGKHFSREMFQSEDDNKKQNSPKIDTYIKRKISLSLTFHMHKPSIGCCVTKRRAKTAGKTRNTTDFHANSNPLEDISNQPCCDVRLLFRTFAKVEKLWTI